MPEHVLPPDRAAELVVLADSGYEVCSVIKARLGYSPWITGHVGVFDADTGGVGGKVACMPGGVTIPHELADCAVSLDLVVGGSWTGLPDVVTAPDGEVACVVVNDNLIDLPTVPAGCVVCVHDEVDVGLEGVPVLHQRCSLSVWVSVGSVLVRGGRLSARLAIASRASRIWAGIGRPRRVAFSIREMPSLDR